MATQGDSLDAGQVAALLKVSRNTVYALVKAGELSSYKVGRKMRFTRGDVDAYIAGAHGAAAAPQEARAAKPDASRYVYRIAGSDMAAELIANYLGQAGRPVERAYTTSYEALHALYRGEAHAAVVHLFDRKTARFNVPYVQRIVPGASVIVLHLATRRAGLAVRSKNPKGLRRWRDLLRDDIVIANRPRGAGSRVLLDEQLLMLEAPARDAAHDIECASSLAAASYVANGMADVCVVDEHVFHQVDGLDFFPLVDEQVDLVLAKTQQTEGVIRYLRRALLSRGFAEDLSGLPGYNTAHVGEVTYEV